MRNKYGGASYANGIANICEFGFGHVEDLNRLGGGECVTPDQPRTWCFERDVG